MVQLAIVLWIIAQVYHRRMPRGLLPTLGEYTDHIKSMAHWAVILEKLDADLKARQSASKHLVAGDPVSIQNDKSKLWVQTGIVDAVRDMDSPVMLKMMMEAVQCCET